MRIRETTSCKNLVLDWPMSFPARISSPSEKQFLCIYLLNSEPAEACVSVGNLLNMYWNYPVDAKPVNFFVF